MAGVIRPLFKVVFPAAAYVNRSLAERKLSLHYKGHTFSVTDLNLGEEGFGELQSLLVTVMYGN